MRQAANGLFKWCLKVVVPTASKEVEMTDIAHHQHCTRPWYMRPPVWLLGVVLVALAVFGIIEMAGKPAATPYGAFLDQLEAGNVASVTFQGTQIEGRFKNPIGNTASNGAAQQTAFRSRVPEFGDPALLPELRKEHVTIDVVSSSNWTSVFARLPWPMVAFLGFILIAGLVRLVRGGSAPSGGGTMPMHGMIGMLSGLFAKQSQPASTSTPEPRK
jgi:ATP-dependent Zn protease